VQRRLANLPLHLPLKEKNLFKLSLIIEGAIEKETIYNTTKSKFSTKTFVSIIKNISLNIEERVKQ
jgi:hypothetical protein